MKEEEKGDRTCGMWFNTEDLAARSIIEVETEFLAKALHLNLYFSVRNPVSLGLWRMVPDISYYKPDRIFSPRINLRPANYLAKSVKKLKSLLQKQ